MQKNNFHIALALTVSLLATNYGFANGADIDSSIKPISCNSGVNNVAQMRDSLSSCDNCHSLSNAGNKSMKQVYSYPEAIYGTNNEVGEQNNKVILSEGEMTSLNSKGVPLAETGSTQMTGAAANIPVIGTPAYDKMLELQNHNDMSSNIKIETPRSQQILLKGFKSYYSPAMTGAAAPLRDFFPDVTGSYWAKDQINRLADEDIVFGYPSSLFKPNSPVTRAEMASMLLRGMNLESSLYNSSKYNFKDVPKNHWAYNIINAASSNDLISGYADNTFRPDDNISKIEAMNMLSKKINTGMSEKNADKILSEYSNGKNVPNWAKINVAKTIEANALDNIPNKNNILSNSNATRAEVASMLDNIRISLGYSNGNVPVASAKSEMNYVASEEMVTVPSLKLLFKDNVSSKNATVGEQFAATTIDTVVIDNVSYPAGSIVRGKVSEVIRPSRNNNGALKLSFETIEHDGQKTKLPTQILAAQVNKIQQPNLGIRLVQMPFSLVGGILGTAGRTVGGAAISLSNAVEQTFNGFGVAGGEMVGGNFKASGRSFQDVGKTIVKAPIDLTRTALSGTMGLFQSAGSDVAYIVDPNGHNVSSLKPNQEVTISFACHK